MERRLFQEQQEQQEVQEFGEWDCHANDVMRLCLVREEGDLEEGAFCGSQKERYDEDQGGVWFHPEFTHALFGDNERITGYKDLSVRVLLLGGSFRSMLYLQWGQQRKKRVGAISPCGSINLTVVLGVCTCSAHHKEA